MKSFHSLAVVSIAAALCACGSRTAPAPVSFSVSTLRAAAGARPDLVLQSGLEVRRVRLEIARLKLEQSETGAASAAAGDDSHAEGEVELVRGPFLIDLDAAALTGKVEKVFDATVPAGTYREIKFEIASVIVDGLIDGQPFSFTTALQAAQKREGSFVVDATSNNVTLAIDPSGWFGASAATRLDPRDAASRGAIEANLRASLRVFQDDDGSGHENHHGGSGHADGGDAHHGDHAGEATDGGRGGEVDGGQGGGNGDGGSHH